MKRLLIVGLIACLCMGVGCSIKNKDVVDNNTSTSSSSDTGEKVKKKSKVAAPLVRRYSDQNPGKEDLKVDTESAFYKKYIEYSDKVKKFLDSKGVEYKDTVYEYDVITNLTTDEVDRDNVKFNSLAFYLIQDNTDFNDDDYGYFNLVVSIPMEYIKGDFDSWGISELRESLYSAEDDNLIKKLNLRLDVLESKGKDLDNLKVEDTKVGMGESIEASGESFIYKLSLSGRYLEGAKAFSIFPIEDNERYKIYANGFEGVENILKDKGIEYTFSNTASEYKNAKNYYQSFNKPISLTTKEYKDLEYSLVMGIDYENPIAKGVRFTLKGTSKSLEVSKSDFTIDDVIKARNAISGVTSVSDDEIRSMYEETSKKSIEENKEAKPVVYYNEDKKIMELFKINKGVFEYKLERVK